MLFYRTSLKKPKNYCGETSENNKNEMNIHEEKHASTTYTDIYSRKQEKLIDIVTIFTFI